MTDKGRKTAIICTNDAWTLYNFRGSLMRALQVRGFHVIAAGPRDRYADQIERMGVEFAHIPMDWSGLNPRQELVTMWHLFRLYRRTRPALVHHFSHKAILYGSIAARFARVPAIVNTVTGLGSTLGEADGLLKRIQPLIIAMMRFALRRPVRVTCQNDYIRDYYLDHRIVRPEQISIILGSGVDTEKFTPAENGHGDRPLQFLMFSRMLWAKGVVEFCEAAEKVLSDPAMRGRVRFTMIGGTDPKNESGVDAVWLSNPQTIPGEWLVEQARRGFVEWIPHQENMLPLVREADVVVLPSYYPEGLPRSLLEAMSCGKAIITTDTPGCRDVVEDGVNGLLVKPRDASDLARAMAELAPDPERVAEMGKASRRMVADRFSDERVIDQTFSTYDLAGISV